MSEIQRYDVVYRCDDDGESYRKLPDVNGKYVLYADHVAALARASSPDPDWAEETAYRIWGRFVGIPVTEPYTPEFKWLVDVLGRTEAPKKTLTEVCQEARNLEPPTVPIRFARPDPAREALVGALNQLLSSPIFTEVIRMVACWDGKEEKKAPPHPFDWPCVIPTVCGEAYALKTYVENLVRTLAEQGHKGATK